MPKKVEHWNETHGTCQSQIQRDSKNPNSFEECRRPAKGTIDHAPACGIHLAAANKRNRRDEG